MLWQIYQLKERVWGSQSTLIAQRNAEQQITDLDLYVIPAHFSIWAVEQEKAEQVIKKLQV